MINPVPNSVTSITLTPTVEEPNAIVAINGAIVGSGETSDPISLFVGNNIISVVVIAQDSIHTKTYTVTVNRAPSGNADLSNLEVSEGVLSPTFESDIIVYTDDVVNSVRSIIVTPTADDNTSSITVNGTSIISGQASAPISLDVGNNTIEVRVTAEDTVTIKLYTVTVTVALSNNAFLSNLQVSEGSMDPSFNRNITSYSDDLPGDKSSIRITPTAEVSGAAIQVNGIPVASGQQSDPINLLVGNNTINVLVTAQDGVTTKTYTIIVARAASANANLSNLEVSEGFLNPSFDPDSESYTDNVPNSITAISVTPTVEDSNSTVTVNGTSVPSGVESSPISLNVFNNTITVIVTAQDGVTTRTYTIIVNRAPSNNAYLMLLEVSEGMLNPGFNKEVTSYSDDVVNGVASIILTPTSEEPNASITVEGVPVNSGSGSNPINLFVGDNTINIVVTAEDGAASMTYTVVVKRAASSNAFLSNLEVSEGTLDPSFDPAITTYSDNVINSVISIRVRPTADDPTSLITVNGDPVDSGQLSLPISLNIGNNIINVVVTAEDGSSSKSYSVTVARAGSGNANLANLEVSEGILNPTFDPDTTSYTDDVPNSVSSITVTPTSEDVNSTITVNGAAVTSGNVSSPIALSAGYTTIEVIVTAQDATIKLYTVEVNRAPAANNDYLVDLVVSEGTLVPGFIKTTTEYSDNVGNGVASMNVTPTVEDPTAIIKWVKLNGADVSGSGSGTPYTCSPLNFGANVIQVMVEAADGVTRRTYIVNVNRESTCQSIIYVDKDSSASSPDGQSWLTAYKTVQEGIDTAYASQQNCGGVIDVWVAEGIYDIHQSSNSDTVQLREYVELYGGFAGNETLRTQRSWTTYETTLDGADAVKHVVTGSDNAVIDGFTVTRGHSTGSNQLGMPSMYGGGGMFNDGVSPKIANCKFINNYAEDDGAGIYNTNCHPRILNSRFELNSSGSSGGAIHVEQEDSGHRAEITNCTFYDNYSANGGSYGMDSGGAIHCDGGSSPIITNCIFDGNTGQMHGGAIGSYQGNNVEVIGCVFENNRIQSSTGDPVGGAICISEASMSITDCMFSNNSSGLAGGAVYYQYSGARLTNCVFVNNDTDWGGAIYSRESTSTIINSTFNGNSSPSGGGAAYCEGGSMKLFNSILWGNSPDQIGIYNGNVSIKYSCVEGGNTQDGNINTNPNFVSGVHLGSGSQCINAGSLTVDPYVPSDDIDGNPRTGNPDMGAYEY